MSHSGAVRQLVHPALAAVWVSLPIMRCQPDRSCSASQCVAAIMARQCQPSAAGGTQAFHCTPLRSYTSKQYLDDVHCISEPFKAFFSGYLVSRKGWWGHSSSRCPLQRLAAMVVRCCVHCSDAREERDLPLSCGSCPSACPRSPTATCWAMTWPAAGGAVRMAQGAPAGAVATGLCGGRRGPCAAVAGMRGCPGLGRTKHM